MFKTKKQLERERQQTEAEAAMKIANETAEPYTKDLTPYLENAFTYFTNDFIEQFNNLLNQQDLSEEERSILFDNMMNKHRNRQGGDALYWQTQEIISAVDASTHLLSNHSVAIEGATTMWRNVLVSEILFQFLKFKEDEDKLTKKAKKKEQNNA